MNNKKYLLMSSAVFAFVFIFDWLFHGVGMTAMYAKTAPLWRPKAEMMNFFPFLMMGQIVFSLLFVFIYSKGVENRGPVEGVRYGLLIGLLYSTHFAGMYASQPIPAKVIMAWTMGTVAEFCLAGMLLAIIYKPFCLCQKPTS